jgi:hypothetical protein
MNMRKRLIAIALVVLALAAIALASDDPFTGTWREVPSKTGDSVQDQLIMAPIGDGITIQETGNKPTTASYGKDIPYEGGSTINIVKVDDHTLTSTIVINNGKNVIKETGTVSFDGKHYTRSLETIGNGRKPLILEYDRVGSVQSGDAFFGTWKSIPRPPLTYTLKVDGETFDWSIGDRHTVTAKFDGKEYKRDNGTFTMQLKRIDDHTIEIVQKPSNDKSKELFNGRELKDLWQVNGNTLIVTGTRQSPNNVQSKSVVEFERIK